MSNVSKWRVDRCTVVTPSGRAVQLEDEVERSAESMGSLYLCTVSAPASNKGNLFRVSVDGCVSQVDLSVSALTAGTSAVVNVLNTDIDGAALPSRTLLLEFGVGDRVLFDTVDMTFESLPPNYSAFF